jgi:hypothetical protein
MSARRRAQAVSGAFSGLGASSALSTLAGGAASAVRGAAGSGLGSLMSEFASALVSQAESLATSLPTQLSDLGARPPTRQAAASPAAAWRRRVLRLRRALQLCSGLALMHAESKGGHACMLRAARQAARGRAGTGSLLDPAATLSEAEAIANLVKTIGSAVGLESVRAWHPSTACVC